MREKHVSLRALVTSLWPYDKTISLIL